jgi:hypothetical protein
MAGIAFKQPCPSCEHPIPIRDASFVGKKIECPKCKYRFIVQKPKAVAEESEPAAAPPAKGAKAAAAAVQTKTKAKTGALRHVEEEDVEESGGKGKPRKRLYVGLGLAGVGLVVLALASYVILLKPSNVGPKKPPSLPPLGQNNLDKDDEKVDDNGNADIDPKKEPKIDIKKVQKKVVEVALLPPGPELTNLLPNDTEHVFHGFFKEVFDILSPFREPIAGKQLADSEFKPRLGFAIAEIDDFIRADRFTGKPWTFTVVHLKEAVDEPAVTAAFGLQRMPTAIRGHDYFKASKPNPWFDQLSHVAVGVPQWLRVIGRDDSRPLCVRFHDPQTMIFADEAPMQELLKNDLQFPVLTGAVAPPAPIKKLDNDPDKKDGDDNVRAPRPNLAGKTYMTIKPKLKEMLDRLESKSDEGQHKPLFSTATELEPARVPNHLLPPDDRGKFIWRGKQVWDLASMLEERKPRLALAGSALLQKSARAFQYRAEFECAEEKEARNILKIADEVLAPELARNFERYLSHKIEIPNFDPMLQPNPAIDPMLLLPKKDVSRWEAAQRDQSVDVKIDLVLDISTIGRIRTLTSLFAMAARSEVELAASIRGRHVLGKEAVSLAEKGDADRKIAAGAFPPGTIKRPAAPTRVGNTPYYRLSWMTALLPQLGHKSLYDQIDFASSWRDPVNWMPARTIVPEFLDGSYPDSARFVQVMGMGVAPAATHVVGISGVGHDAADYPRNDPAFAAKRGIFGYDGSATLAEIQKGRGASNIVMLMQIPHDGLTGVSPWMAGGGSTVRGVPEKNSLAPFVLSNDKHGKPITYKGQRGTYVTMADGSVHFLNANTPDEIVKALCVVQGAGQKADFFGEEHFPLVPDPAAKAAPKIVAAPKTPPNEAVETKKK